ncbi:hypothetical protein L2E82_30338 [Cichorium intybus]|uniref:Uncharacterized protein n=1 Tax=Cichorium intybus TaxID=13427 RepID=A0ACB9D0F7_CICIN|nr:hypothetical protein L2E82_30338 [Cichorium intybus]
MTRSSQPNIIPALNEPEREFNARRRIRRSIFSKEKPRQEMDIPVNEPEPTLKAYYNRARDGTGPSLVRPKIPENANFELKGHYLSALKGITFKGTEEEDPVEHIKQVTEITDCFNIPGISSDAIMLRIFPMTLREGAKKWLKRLPPGSITTWNGLKQDFIEEYTPPSKINKLKANIQNFLQDEDETLYQAWSRFKELIQDCPQHDMEKHQKDQKFYDCINTQTRQLLDGRGPLINLTATEAYERIEELAKHSHHYHSSRDPSCRRKLKEEAVEGMSAIHNRLDQFGRDLKKMTQNIHAITVGCDNCSGPHLQKDCPYDEDGNKKAEACYSSGDRFDYPIRRNNWRGGNDFYNQQQRQQPPFERQQNTYNQQKQPPPGFNPQHTQEKKLNLEDILGKFMEGLEKRHTTTEVQLRNQAASIQNIENQIGQISKVLQERLPGTLPTNTEPNPRAQAKAITTGSGKIIPPAVIEDAINSTLETQKDKAGKDSESTKDGGTKETASPQPHQPTIPFPQRLKKEKEDKEFKKFLEHLKQLNINIPFVDAITQMPKYAKFLKDLLTNRKKMEEVSLVTLSEKCYASMMKNLPEKVGDPGGLHLPCTFGNHASSYGLADLGASINLMPYSFYKKLNLPEPKPVQMAINLANKAVTYPRGIVEDLLVKVDKFVFPVDFVILDMEEDDEVPILL